MKYYALTLLLGFASMAYSQHKLQFPNSQNNFSKQTFQYRSATNVESDSANVIWHEDFANGLNGNNSSADPSWTTDGDDEDIWQKDNNGSNGDWAGTTPYTLDSETAQNGWIMFDADSSNAGLESWAYSERMGTLTSPYIDLSSDTNVTLSFQHAFRWCCYSNHKLVVYINDGTGWNDDNSFQVNEFGAVNELTTTTTVELIISDIAALKDSVQIRFDWGNNEETASHYFWMIDDVKIVKTEAYSSNILNTFNLVPSEIGATSYRLMPIDQISNTAYYFGGMFNNTGFNVLDSMRVMAEIDSAVFSAQSNGYSIASAESDTLYVNDGFTPQDTGTYICNIFGVDDNNFTTTDTLRERFEVSQYTYARDNGNNVSGFGRYPINDKGSHQFGNVFNIYNSSSIQAVSMRIDPRTGSSASGKIYINSINAQQNNADFQVGHEFLAEFPVPYLGSYAGDWVNFVIPPFQVDSGDILLVTLYAEFTGGANDTVFISTAGNNPNSGESRLQDIDGVGDNTFPSQWFWTTFSPCIRLNFNPDVEGPNVSTNDNNSNYALQLYPNPNNGKFRLQFNSKHAKKGILSIKDVLGRTIQTEQINTVEVFSKQYDLRHLNKGIYFIHLSIDAENDVIKRVIIH